MSFTTKLKVTEYEKIHGGKYVLIVTNNETGQSAFGSCNDETLKAELKHLRKELLE